MFITFSSLRQLIKFETSAKLVGLKFKIVPMPSSIPGRCGPAIEIIEREGEDDLTLVHSLVEELALSQEVNIY
ncbi:MAG: DUF3343 domain-containing protein [Oligoflexia bacterium]|nr:DUF3343 domain-containing protein [Oligoflexia bacterium]